MTELFSQSSASISISGPRVPPPPPSSGRTSDQTRTSYLSSASSYTDLHYLFGEQDPTMIGLKGPKNNRRKLTPTSEHVKHRRTRSGCYTCRSRRVKCDETHPICERCKKGGRECVYPEASASKSNSSASTASQRINSGSPESSGDDDDEYDEAILLDTIPDESENGFAMGGSGHRVRPGHQEIGGKQSIRTRKSLTRYSSETPSLIQDKGNSPSPSTEGSIGFPAHTTFGTGYMTHLTANPAGTKSDWSLLPQDLQFYLQYFCENITAQHYSLKQDSGDFLRTHLLDAALRYEPLLYAVVGFSAFQRTLQTPGGKIQDFLQYYNKAVALLLRSLKRSEKHSIGTLLAMLQLATIEEYLGDWVNLLGHQKAAYALLTEIFTPQTVMESELSRSMFGMYARFDVYAGLLGGFAATLSREWFEAAASFFYNRTLMEPHILKWKIEKIFADTRLIAMDMSTLFARMGKGEISLEQFHIQNQALGKRIYDWRDKMDPALLDPRYRVFDFSGARPRDPDDIVDPYIPGVLYQGSLWAMNLAMIDWYSVDLMHKYQTALTLQQQPSKELAVTAYASCQLLEAIEYWPGSPKGALLACQSSLGISSLFMPRDRRHSMWARRKLARIESHGYIYPLTFRTKMSAHFQDLSCMHWWLPHDEGYPPIIRSIRQLVEERTAPATNDDAEGLRDMRTIFARLDLSAGEGAPGLEVGGGMGAEVVGGRGWGDEQGDFWNGGGGGDAMGQSGGGRREGFR